MKVLIVLLAGFAFAAAQTPSQKIEQTILGLQRQMPCMDPPLAPYKGEYFDLYHKNFIFKIHGAISDFIFEGLNDFDIYEVNLNVLTLKMNLVLNFNKLRVSGKYNIGAGLLGLLNISGNGKLDISLKNFRVNVYGRIGMVNSVLRMMDLDVGVGLDEMKSKNTGLKLGSFVDSLANSILDKTIMTFITDNRDLVTENIREIAMPQINEFLKDYTVKDILDLLQTPPSEEIPCEARRWPLL